MSLRPSWWLAAALPAVTLAFEAAPPGAGRAPAAAVRAGSVAPAGPSSGLPSRQSGDVVSIPDGVVRQRIELALGKVEGEPVTAAEMATLTSLDLSRVVATDLTGLEHAVNLRELFLGGNALADLSPLDGLAVAVRHTTAPGVGNLTYGGDEPWQPIATLRAPRTPLNMGYARAFMAGGYLNLIWARADIDAGIDVWDVSDPRDPVLHRTWDDDRLREAHGLGLWNRDGRIVLAAQSHEGVAFYDVTDVGERLPLLAELDLPGVGAADYGGAWWLSVQAPHVYVATIGGGLHVVDATDPAAPRQVNHLPTGALGGISPGNAYALGNLLVLAAVDRHRGFATLDISDPVNPVLLDTTNGAAGYSHLFAAGLLLSSGNRLNGNRMYVHRVDHDGRIRYVGEAGENLDEGGYGSYQDGHFFSGFTEQVAKFTIDPPAQVGVGTSGIDLRDEDWAQPLGNLILASDDKNVGTALIPHQAAPDATGPEVVWRHPAAGATGLALTTRIGVSLSDVVAVESLTPANFRVRAPGGGVVAGQLSVNQNNVNFSPDAPLAPSTTYAVEVCHLADLVGNAGGCAGWTFTTRAEETGGRAPTCSLARLAPVEAGVETTYVPASTAHAPTAHTWDFGAGEPVGPQVTPVAAFTYPAPGRFPVILRVSNAHGASQCSAVQIVHAPVTDVAPVSSSSIVTTVTRVDVNPHPDFWTSRNLTDVYVANPDNDTVTRLFWDNTKVWETKVGDNPRTLAVEPDDDLWAPDRIWVANQGSGDISVLNRDGDLVRTIDLGYGAAPYGIVFAPDGGAAYVTLEGSGRLLKLDPETGRTVAGLDLGAGPRGIAVSGDSRRIFVTRFVSAFAESDGAGEDDAAGEVYEVDAAAFTVTRIFELAFDPGPDTESSGRGVPNYLSQVRIAPDGGTAWIPSKKDNIARGRHRDGNDLDFETQTRTVVSQIDLTANAEAPDRRIDFDDRDLAQALAFTPAGDAVVVAFQGSNVIEVWDANALTRLSEVSVGRAPAGLAFSPDGRRLYVHNFLDRSVTVLNTAGLRDGTVNEPPVVATVSTVAGEALAPEVLRGKRIFYNAADARMSLDGYLSCASCHLDGGSDGMVWDRTQFGEGLRNTIDLRGRRGANGGFVHWTANFDEIQDFEHDMRGGFGGTGFMADGDFRTGTRDEPLGDPKAGVSADLDALAAYVSSLAEVPDSPHREADGSLTAAGRTGRRVFAEQGCAACHAGADFTDDGMHDVGTHDASSGLGRGASLDGVGLNTPTLKGLWLGAPYLHNGAAATLGAVLDNPAHVGGGLTGGEKAALEAYLLQMDDNESGPARVDIATAAPPAVTGAFVVTITFSEAVTGFEPADVRVGNGTASSLRGSGAAYTATIAPAANGPVTVEVPAAVAEGASGNPNAAAPRLVREAIVEPLSVHALAIASSAGGDGRYGIGEAIRVTARFDGAVTVDGTGGTPSIAATVGGTARRAAYSGGSGTGTLVFAYTVREGDEDTDGVSIEAASIGLNGGALVDRAGGAARLAHPAVAAQGGHRVDGVRPALLAAAADAAALTLTYREALQAAAPPVSAFAVSGGDVAHVVTGVSVLGRAVTLALDPAVARAEAGLTVSYRPPGSDPLRDLAGNASARLLGQPVTNETPAVDYDADDDGLIEIATLAQLDAVRHDLDGDGVPAGAAAGTGAGGTGTASAAGATAAGATAATGTAAARGGVAATGTAAVGSSAAAVAGASAAGSGEALAPGAAVHAAAFPEAAEGMGCPAAGCVGYELAADLDFDTDGSGAASEGDAFWNGGAGWLPLGTFDEPFTAMFAGNGRTVSHLFVGGGDNAGLFGMSSGVIRGVGVSAAVTGSQCAGALAGLNGGRVEASWSTGAVTGDSCVGGLVGVNGLWAPDGGTFRPLAGVIAASWSAAAATAEQWVGGLVGYNNGAVAASYAAGAVTATTAGSGAGGLVGRMGFGGNRITASYATGAVSGPGGAVGGLVGHAMPHDRVEASYWDTETSGMTRGGGGAGRTTAALQEPTGYTGLYADWDVDVDGDGVSDAPWDFGTSSAYPALSVDADGDGAATGRELGAQGRAVPRAPASGAGAASDGAAARAQAGGATARAQADGAAARAQADGAAARAQAGGTAAPAAFTDDPLVPGVTPVRAAHLLELRSRIDALRRRAGLPAFGWTDAHVVPGVTPARAVHLLELRSALGAAYAAAGRPAPGYTDAVVTAGATAMRAVQLQELRAAVLALEGAPPGVEP